MALSAIAPYHGFSLAHRAGDCWKETLPRSRRVSLSHPPRTSLPSSQEKGTRKSPRILSAGASNQDDRSDSGHRSNPEEIPKPETEQHEASDTANPQANGPQQTSGTHGDGSDSSVPRAEAKEESDLDSVVSKLMSALNDDDIRLEVDELNNAVDLSLEVNVDNVQSMVYRLVGILALLDFRIFFLREEDGVPLSQIQPDRMQLADTMADLAGGRGVEPETVKAVKALLESGDGAPPLVVRASGEISEYAPPLGYDVNSGHMFLGELGEGWDAQSASKALGAEVRRLFPGHRLALMPFPETAQDVAQQFGLDPSRRCSLLLFKQFSILRIDMLSFLSIPAFFAALFQLKAVAVSIPGVSSDYDSVQAAVFFGFAALLPAGSAFLGKEAWSLAYKKPLDAEFLPVLAPGAGIATILTRLTRVPDSRTMTLDLALATSLASLATSLALLNSSSCSAVTSAPPLPTLPSLESFGIPEAASTAFPGTVIVPESFLSHSPFFNQMADLLSCAALPDPRSTTDVLFAIPPLALAGLLGLHLTAMCLFPFASSNGGRVVEALVEDDTALFWLQALATLFVAWCMVSTGAPEWIVFFFATSIAAFSLSSVSVRPLRWDGVSPPGLGRSALGVSLVACGVFVMLPEPLFGWILDRGFAPLADSLMVLVLPPR